MNSFDKLKYLLRQEHNEEEKAKAPEWQRLDLKPVSAGVDLLHNEHGTPKARGRSVPGPVPEQMLDRPVFVEPAKEQRISFGPLGRVPAVGAQQQAWDVAGDVAALTGSRPVDPREVPYEQQVPRVTDDGFIDNNDFIAIDSMQQSQAQEYQRWQANFSSLAGYFSNLHTEDEMVNFGQKFDQVYGQGAFSQFLEAMYGGKQQKKQEQSPSITQLDVNQYFVLVRGQPYGIVQDLEILDKNISSLLNKGVKIEEIVVLKRIAISFGARFSE